MTYDQQIYTLSTELSGFESYNSCNNILECHYIYYTCTFEYLSFLDKTNFFICATFTVQLFTCYFPMTNSRQNYLPVQQHSILIRILLKSKNLDLFIISLQSFFGIENIKSLTIQTIRHIMTYPRYANLSKDLQKVFMFFRLNILASKLVMRLN